MIRLLITSVFSGILFCAPAGAKTFVEMFPQFGELEAGEDRDFLESLDYLQGKIELRGGFAEIEVPEGYYFLGPEHAEKVTTEGWGNPPDEELPLGMIFPADVTPFHSGSWAVEITWDDIGYVSDEDADEVDYDDLLDGMKSDTVAQNAWRRENGYQSITLVGWAAQPHYDPVTRRLHWAKELSFEGSEANTLNYNIRVLGRKGVLVMNFIAGIEVLPEVEAALPDVLALASFRDGARYGDFDVSIDEIAAVGIGGLIAGKVLAKAGLLVLALAFLKKGGFLLVLLLAPIWRFLTGRQN